MVKGITKIGGRDTRNVDARANEGDAKESECVWIRRKERDEKLE